MAPRKFGIRGNKRERNDSILLILLLINNIEEITVINLSGGQGPLGNEERDENIAFNTTGLEIGTDAVANATNIFSLVTKNSGLVAT